MPGFALAQNCRVTALSRRALDKAQESARQYNIPLAFDSAEEMCRSSGSRCRAGYHSQCLPSGRRAAGSSLRQARVVREADGRARQRVPRDGRSRSQRRAATGRSPGLPLRREHRLFAGACGCRSDRQDCFCALRIFLSRRDGTPRAWLHDSTVAGGGPIADVGVHCVDALRYILQDEVVRVCAQGQYGPGSVESAAVIALEFSRGTLATVTVSFRAEYRTPFELVGETGVLRADNALTVERPIKLELRRAGSVVETERGLESTGLRETGGRFRGGSRGQSEVSGAGGRRLAKSGNSGCGLSKFEKREDRRRGPGALAPATNTYGALVCAGCEGTPFACTIAQCHS